MGKCNYCGKEGFFVAVDPKMGVCLTCKSTVGSEIQQRTRVVVESLQIIQTSSNWKTKLSRAKTIDFHLDPLLELERKGVRCGFSVESVKNDVAVLRNDAIDYAAKSIYSDAQVNIDAAATPRTRITAATKALKAIGQLEQEAGLHGAIAQVTKGLRAYIHKTQFGQYVEEAKKAEFKGNWKKAVDQYKEALYFLKTDAVDDAKQAGAIRNLEQKIAEIESKLPAPKRSRLDG